MPPTEFKKFWQGRAETGHLKSNMSETTLPIKVKWLKNKYDVNVMLDEPAEVLKAQVCSVPCSCFLFFIAATGCLSALDTFLEIDTILGGPVVRPYRRPAREAENYCWCQTNQR
jgi:hypothetical protein